MKNCSPAALRAHPWLSLEPHDAFQRAKRSLLSMQERKMLYWLGREWYSGAGAVIDLGSFLGSSTVAFAAGLRDGSHAGGLIHAYDLFQVSRDRDTQRILDKKEGDSFLEDYQETIRGYEDLVTTHAGDLKAHPWNGGPIEILFVDLAKSWEMNEYIVRTFYRHLIPGKSLLIHQDFGNSWNPWLAVSMGYLDDYFSIICDEATSRVYRSEAALPEATLNVDYKKDLDRETRLACMRKVLGTCQGSMLNKQHGAMAILTFIEDGEEAGLQYIDAVLPTLDLSDFDRQFLQTVRQAIDIWTHGWAYEMEMASKF